MGKTKCVVGYLCKIEDFSQKIKNQLVERWQKAVFNFAYTPKNAHCSTCSYNIWVANSLLKIPLISVFGSKFGVF